MRWFQFDVPKYLNIKIPFYEFFANYLMKRPSPWTYDPQKRITRKLYERRNAMGRSGWARMNHFLFLVFGTILFRSSLSLPQKDRFPLLFESNFEISFRSWFLFYRLRYLERHHSKLIRWILRDEALGDTCRFQKEDGNMNYINQSTCPLSAKVITKTSKDVLFEWFLRTKRKCDLLLVRSLKLLVRYVHWRSKKERNPSWTEKTWRKIVWLARWKSCEKRISVHPFDWVSKISHDHFEVNLVFCLD